MLFPNSRIQDMFKRNTMEGQRINLKANLVLNWILILVQHCWNPNFKYLLLFHFHVKIACYIFATFLVPCEIWMLVVLLRIHMSQGMVHNMLTNNHSVKINSPANNTFSHGHLKKIMVLRVLLCISPYLLYIVNLLKTQGKGQKSFLKKINYDNYMSTLW
jgi:hypothetical protein